MDYDSLNKIYRNNQIQRITLSLKKVRERTNPAGRVVPDTGDLVIGAGRRLNIAVMFLDICGFSSHHSNTSYEQDQILSALTLFFTEMVRIAEDFGATVEKNTGDGLMAYFEDNGGEPPEGGCKRAVACALTMMDSTSSIINPILKEVNIEPIRFRIAIDYGPVTIARLGAAKRFNAIVAIGTSANIASKMLDFATQDEILVGEDVQRRLPPQWQINWTQKLEIQTGWIYLASNQPYPFYRYTGRWVQPK